MLIQVSIKGIDQHLTTDAFSSHDPNTLYMLMTCCNILVYFVPVSSHFKNTNNQGEKKTNLQALSLGKL